MRGSQHNDKFIKINPNSNNNLCHLKVTTNNAGGTLGGITSGANIIFRVAVKPVSTIGKGV